MGRNRRPATGACPRVSLAGVRMDRTSAGTTATSGVAGWRGDYFQPAAQPSEICENLCHLWINPLHRRSSIKRDLVHRFRRFSQIILRAGRNETDVLVRRSPRLFTRTDEDVRPTPGVIPTRAKYRWTAPLFRNGRPASCFHILLILFIRSDFPLPTVHRRTCQSILRAAVVKVRWFEDESRFRVALPERQTGISTPLGVAQTFLSVGAEVNN